MNLRSSAELSKLLGTYLSPRSPVKRPSSLHTLCLRTAAIYATTALYEFNDKHKSLSVSQSTNWDDVFPLLDAHFLSLVPCHLYAEFLDNVLCALEVAAHYDSNGKNLMQYVILFFPPRSMRSFKLRRCYKDRVLMPTISCLHKCVSLEELYLEKAESPAITTYLLAHIIKFLNRIRVLALPKQCDDDVASVIGLNCPKLECVILTGTSVTNGGLSWLMCCRQLNTLIIPGFFQDVTPKGVALLLNGLKSLKHVVYDNMSEVLTYIDFNTTDLIVPILELRTLLFHSMELLTFNHLELVSKMCPYVEWLSLDSALFYNLEGLNVLPHLRLLRLNYKGRPIDDTVVDFFRLSCAQLTTLQFFDVKEMTLEDLSLVGQCPQLEVLVLQECSIVPDWRARLTHIKVISRSVDHLQIFSLQILPYSQLVDFISLFRDLHILELDKCELDNAELKQVLLDQSSLHTLRCGLWPNISMQQFSDLQGDFLSCRLETSKESPDLDEYLDRRTMAVKVLDEYAGVAPLLKIP